MDCAQFEGMAFDDNKELNEVLREQFPDGLILTMRAVGKTKKFEISFLNEEGRVAALNRPFNIHGKAIVVSPTLGSGARIVRVGITGILGLDSVSICNRLTEILSPCGDILELGLHYMPSGHWFNGRGFATLNCATDKTYNGKLKHQMPFNDHRHITLVWSNMGVVCKECHSDEHIKADCPVYKERTIKRCYNCQSPNHVKANCPDMPWNRRRKQPRRDPYTPDLPNVRADRGISPRVQGRPNGPPPTTTFNPFAALEFADGPQGDKGHASNAVASAANQRPEDKGESSSAESTTSVQTGKSPANATTNPDGTFGTTTDNTTHLDLDQHVAQQDGSAYPSQNWADSGNTATTSVGDDDSVMEMDPTAASMVDSDQDDGMQTDGEETEIETSSARAAPPTNLPQGVDTNFSAGTEQQEGQCQPQFNRDGSLNLGFRSRSGRAYKSPDRQ